LRLDIDSLVELFRFRLGVKRQTESIRGLQIIRGRTFIVIDDISTTGGTINEVRKILKKAGAKKVLGFTVAH